MARGMLLVWLAVLGLAVACWTRAAEPPVEAGDLVTITAQPHATSHMLRAPHRSRSIAR